MLKIKKGIKKKIKGKKDKGKDEDDLFDPEQLEKLKKELAEKRKAAAGETGEDSSEAVASSSLAAHEQDEEWLKFQALTAGVDNVLKKTSQELGKIKETSFYQGKSNDPTNLWKSDADKERERVEAEAAVAAAAAEAAAEKSRAEQEAAEEESKEEEGKGFIDPDELPETEEIDDTFFDTSYLDAIASGEIQLAYIPDSPTEEEGDDPFDTSGVADVVKRIEEAEKQAKRQVNLGSAVDVLSGRAAPVLESRARPKAGESGKKARARPRAVNLLGEEGEVPTAAGVVVAGAGEPRKDIFDDILGSSPVSELEPPLLEKVNQLVKPSVAVLSEETQGGKNVVDNSFLDILGEFDVISSVPLDSSVQAIPTSAILAAILDPQGPEEDELDDEFAALAAESIHNKGPLEQEEEEDPFDTTFVEKVAPPGKFELKLIESEVLGEKDQLDLNEDDEFDFNPRVGEALAPGSVCPHPSPRSLLEDHSPSGEHPPALQPVIKASREVTGDLVETSAAPGSEHDDPFDTSKVEFVLPGKVELKFLEEELLKAVEDHPKPKRPALPIILSAPVPPPVVFVDDDDDFDPRKDEPQPESVKSQTDLLFEIPHSDDHTETKVLTPQLEDKEVEFDPFDTSIASALILEPGQLELRLLESELVTSEPLVLQNFPFPLKQEFDPLSDPEFDPRGGEEPDPFIVPLNHTLKTEDIFDHPHEDIHQAKPLIPQQESERKLLATAASLEGDFEDPFDTSSIEVSKLLPQSELRQIEGELLSTTSQPLPTINPLTLHQIIPTVPVEPLKPPTPEEVYCPVPQSLFDVDDHTELELGHKPLTPAEVPSLSTCYIDPFDTSIAEGIVPGKVEIKVLEEELGVLGTVPLDHLSDPDFNPRGPQPIHPSALSFVSKTLEPQRASDVQNLSEDVDPFDTSAADNLGPTSVSSGPGKSELKALEAELL